MLTCQTRPNRLKLLMYTPPSVACSAVNTSFMPSPSACALSRSMSRQIDGLLAVKVEKTRVSRWVVVGGGDDALHDAAHCGRVLPFQRLELVFETRRWSRGR